jgi:hypothetical protein
VRPFVLRAPSRIVAYLAGKIPAASLE